MRDIVQFFEFLINFYRNFIHQGLDLVDNLVSVGLVDVGAEGDLPLLGVLRYGRHTEHSGRG